MAAKVCTEKERHFYRLQKELAFLLGNVSQKSQEPGYIPTEESLKFSWRFTKYGCDHDYGRVHNHGHDGRGDDPANLHE